MTSPRRQLAITGTWSCSAKRTRSFEQRARSTPAPARISGRSAPARKLSTARRSPTVGASGCGRTTGARVPSGSAEVLDVLGDRQQRGARAALDGRRGRRPRGRRGGLRVVEPPGPLREAADRADEVDLLERLAAREPAVDVADDDEHRRRVGGGGVDADGEVRGADGARAEAQRGAAGQLAVGLGGEGGGALVAGGDDPDAGGGERVEDAEEALAGDGERDPDARGAERGGDQLGDGRGLGGGGGDGLGLGAGVRVVVVVGVAPSAARGRRLGGSGVGRRAGSGSASARLGLRLGVRLGLGARAPGSGSASSAGLARRLRLSAGSARARPAHRLSGASARRPRLGGVRLGARASSARLRARDRRMGRPRGRRGTDPSRPPVRPDGGPSGAGACGCGRAGVRSARGGRGGRRDMPSDQAGDHHQRDDDHDHAGRAGSGHRIPPSGSSRTGAGRPRPARGAGR